MTVFALRQAAIDGKAEFYRVLAERFPGVDEFTWLHATAKHTEIGRYPTYPKVEALAADTTIATAWNGYINLLYAYYRARDGENGFLKGSRRA